MSDQENCIMVATYNLWLQVNTFPAGLAADGGTGNCSPDLRDEWSSFIPVG